MYLDYVINLKFEESPDYVYLRNLFKELFVRKGFINDNIFDWTLIPLKYERPLTVSN